LAYCVTGCMDDSRQPARSALPNSKSIPNDSKQFRLVRQRLVRTPR
jgi:hypothetical protein